MKTKHLFQVTCAAFLLMAMFAAAVGAFTPETVETAAEPETALADTALAEETTSDTYGKLLFHFSFNSGDKANQVPDYIDESIALTTGNNGGSLTVLAPNWWAVDQGKFVVNGRKQLPFGMQFKFTEPITTTGKYTLEFQSTALSNVFGRFYDATTNKEVSNYVSDASGKTVFTTYAHSSDAKLSQISDVRVYGNADGSIYCDYVKLWYLAPVEITFNYGIDTSLLVGDAPATRELYKGDPLPALTAKGYVFEGYVDQNGNKISIVPADPTTVTAVWTKGEVLFAFDFNSNSDPYTQQPSYIDERISLTQYNSGKSALLWPSAEWISMENGAYKIGSSQKNYALRFTFAEPITEPGTYTFKIDSKNISAAFIDMTVSGQTKRSSYIHGLDKNSFTTLSFSYILQPGESLTDIYAYANEGTNTTALFDNATFIYSGDANAPVISPETSVRTKDPIGIRFKASVQNRVLADYDNVEIGFVVARETEEILNIIASDYSDELVLELVDDYGPKYAVKGAAYEKKDQVIKTNYMTELGDGEYSYFTACMIGIPEKYYKENIIVRPYVTIDATTYYGEVKTESLYNVAKNSSDKENETIKDIIAKGDSAE